MKILLADDEQCIHSIVSRIADDEGYELVSAYDGAQVLEVFEAEAPDLVILDVMMPRMDGFQVCRTLRAEGNNVPIIMITAREEETDKVFCLELGADDYITKPQR